MVACQCQGSAPVPTFALHGMAPCAREGRSREAVTLRKWLSADSKESGFMAFGGQIENQDFLPSS